MVALAILRRHMIVFRRNWWSNVMMNFLEPFMYLSAMGFGLGAFVQQMDGMSYVQFMAPGMVGASAMWAATFECTYASFIRLHFQKTFHAILAGPATIGDIVLGEVLFGMVKSVVFGMVIMLVIGVLGQLQSVWSLLIPLFLLLPGAVFSLLALSYTAWVSHIDYMNYYITLAITPMYLISGIFFPANTLSLWLQYLNWFNPLFHSVEVCRALATGRIGVELWANVLVLALGTLLFCRLPGRLLAKKIIS